MSDDLNSVLPIDLRSARWAAKLSQAGAAEVVHVAAGTWHQWETGKRPLSLGLFELFLLKTGLRGVALPTLRRTAEESSAAREKHRRLYVMAYQDAVRASYMAGVRRDLRDPPDETVRGWMRVYRAAWKTEFERHSDRRKAREAGERSCKLAALRAKTVTVAPVQCDNSPDER